MTRPGSEGPISAPLALYGEALGSDEVLEGKRTGTVRPFVGRAGKLLDSCISAAGLSRPTLRIGNFLAAHPSGNDISPWYWEGTSREEYDSLIAAGGVGCAIPTDWESDRYHYYALTPRGMEARAEMLAEIATLDAKVIVPLGNVPTLALTGSAKITDLRGSPFASAIPGRIVMPSLHPAGILRGGTRGRSDEEGAALQIDRHYLTADLRKAKAMAAPGFELPTPRLDINLGLDEVFKKLDEVHASGHAAFDIETPMRMPKLLAFSFCYEPGRAFAVPMGEQAPEFGWAEQREIIERLRAIAEDPEMTLVFQNGIFDTYILEEAHGFEWRCKMEDTMVAHRILYPDLLSSLNVLESLYTFYPFYKREGKESRRVGNRDMFLRYSAMDALVTEAVWTRLEPMLKAAVIQRG